MRQRIHTRTPRLRAVSRAVLLVFALALGWYGVMLVLVAAGLPMQAADRLTGHRTALLFFSSLAPDDLTPLVRAIAGAAGLVAFVVFGLLALVELPRPYLARGEVTLSADEHGRVTIEPRALERLAESAASRHPAVSSASGRWGDQEMTVNVGVRRSGDLAATLRDVRGRVREAITEHGLPERRVNVTLAGYDSSRPRELA